MTSSLEGHETKPSGPWRTTAAPDPSELAHARVEAINIVQWLARIANSYVDEPDAKSRVVLQFRPSESAIATKPFGNAIALEVRLPTLELQFLEGGRRVPHIFDPEEHSPAELEAWLLVELLHRGIDREKFSKNLPYTVPGLMSGDAEDYSPQLCRQGLNHLAALLQDATAVLAAAVHAPADGADVSLACDPQTLDLMTEPGRQTPAGSIAFSLGDAENPEPRFYLRSIASDGAGRNSKRPLIEATALKAEPNPIAAAAKLALLARS